MATPGNTSSSIVHSAGQRRRRSKMPDGTCTSDYGNPYVNQYVYPYTSNWENKDKWKATMRKQPSTDLLLVQGD